MKKSAHIQLALLASVALSSCSDKSSPEAKSGPLDDTQSATASWIRPSNGHAIYFYRGGGFFPCYYRAENYTHGIYVGPEYTPKGMMATGAKAAAAESSGIAARGGSFAEANPSVSRGGFGSGGHSCGGESGGE